MPTQVFFGSNCIIDNSHALTGYGQKALIVTGRNSAKSNGSPADIIKALNDESLDYIIFDKVMTNPTVEICYEGAALAREHQAVRNMRPGWLSVRNLRIERSLR